MATGRADGIAEDRRHAGIAPIPNGILALGNCTGFSLPLRLINEMHPLPGHRMGLGERREANIRVCTENLIRVADVMESPKLAE
jgi:hypothetical protein